ncbi:hypothetical protein FBU30_001293 [Linnemannia zychae]|nr:hypothetical protein FBU30_001293 [Linnemannia zychae]
MISPVITHKWDGKVTYAKRPKVLIVGGGIAGLVLGMVLQKSDTPYDIFERSMEVHNFGSALLLTATTAAVFKQLGIWEELCALSKEIDMIQVRNEDLESEFNVSSIEDPVKRYGSNTRLITRPELYDFLLLQIPRERIHFGKKILSTQQGGNGVIIRCSDKSEYEGDILVGADGVHSAVRQNLFAQLKKETKLPLVDDVPLPFNTVCLLGQTRPLTEEEFPMVKMKASQFVRIIGKNKPYTWTTMTTQQQTVCYSVVEFLTPEACKDTGLFHNSEWTSEVAEAMCRDVRHFPVASGSSKTLTLGDLIELTPRDCIGKLIGGAGTINAIHDAVVLANYIHTLPDHPNATEIENCFRTFQEERFPWGIKGKVFRTLMKHVPKWLSGDFEKKNLSIRPQLNFLPHDQDEAALNPIPQPSLYLKRPSSIQQKDYIATDDKTHPI